MSLDTNSQTLRTRQSERVADVAVALVQYAVMAIMRVRLSSSDARRIAESGDIRNALIDLENRLRITRVTPGILSNSDFQTKLAVLEVTSTPGLTAAERGDVIRGIMEAQREAAKQSALLHEEHSVLNDMMDDLEERDVRLRTFVREAKRLYSTQIERLRRHVADDDDLNRAKEQLDQIYVRHLAMALTWSQQS
jgi:hypothetical protein